MGTREVYEEKLKRGNLHHDPTIKLGLGSARCPRCLSLLNSNSKSGEWAITPILHDFTAVQSKGEGGREEREIGIEKWQERRKRESKFGILLKLRVASIIIQNGKKRENCYTRVREDRSRLLWKLRFANNQPHKDLVKSSLEDIVFDEVQKFKHSYQSETFDNSKFSLALDDGIWQYDGLHEAYQGDCEEMLLEMQRIFYEDLRMEETKEQVSNETWEDEEDEYLARAVYEHMNLNEKAGKEVWCPICKQGELKEDCHHIYCSPCGLRLNRDDEVNLEVLRNRLDEAHSDHLDQGCKLKPKFCVETRFDLTALYITCQGCNMFEVVM